MDRLLATPTMSPYFPARVDRLLGPFPIGSAMMTARAWAASARTHPAWRTAGEIAVAAIPTVEMLPLLAAAAALMPRTEASGTPARLPDGEFRNGPRGRLLPFRSRQRCTDQRTVHRAFFFLAFFLAFLVFLASLALHAVLAFLALLACRIVVHHSALVARLRIGARVVSSAPVVGDHFLHRRWRLRRIDRQRFIGQATVDAVAVVRNCGVCGVVRDALRAVRGHLRVERGGRVGLATLAGNLGVLVFVLGVARGASCLPHVGTDHRDHSVVGHAAFAGTIIVQNVTKPKLALLHLRSRELDHRRGMYLRKAGPS